MAVTLTWVADGAPRMEVAHVQHHGAHITAVGTQLGSAYELRYRLEPRVLSLEVVGLRSLEVELGDADFFDLGFSPLFNSLPVIRDALHSVDTARRYVMRWVDVPSLVVTPSEQRYEPLGNDVIRFRAADFTADIRFDEDGFVVDYPGARETRVDPAAHTAYLLHARVADGGLLLGAGTCFVANWVASR